MTRETKYKADGRPTAPKHLTPFQKKLWREVVGSEPASFFESPANQLLLVEFVRHAETANFVARYIAITEAAQPILADARAYADLLKLREQASKNIASLATKLRMTNQSRYTPQAAATAAKGSASGSKPWDYEG